MGAINPNCFVQSKAVKRYFLLKAVGYARRLAPPEFTEVAQMPPMQALVSQGFPDNRRFPRQIALLRFYQQSCQQFQKNIYLNIILYYCKYLIIYQYITIDRSVFLLFRGLRTTIKSLSLFFAPYAIFPRCGTAALARVRTLTFIAP